MSIYDRDYMRGQGEKKSALSDFFGRISAVKALIIINVAIFIIGAFVDRFFGYGTFFSMFDLSLPGLASGKIWTVITYSFLHAGLAHIAFNMIALYFMGTPLESWIGVDWLAKILICVFRGGFGGRGAMAAVLVWLARRACGGVGFGNGGFRMFLRSIPANACHFPAIFCPADFHKTNKYA